MLKNKIPEIIMSHEFAQIPISILKQGIDEDNKATHILAFNDIIYPDHHIMLPERKSEIDLPVPIHQHINDGVELILITRGSAYIAIRQEPVKELNVGDIAIINPFEPHHLIGVGSFERICIAFIPSMFISQTFDPDNIFERISKNKLILDNLVLTNDVLNPILRNLINEIVTTATEQGPGWTLLVMGNVYSTVYHMMNNRRYTEKNDIDYDAQFIRMLIQFINSNELSEITSNAVANHMRYSNSYFCRKFKGIFGQTFTNYINYCKIMKAKRLIDDSSDISITRIAAMSGFSNSSYFSNKFRQIIGVSPSEYMNGDGI